MTDTVRLAKYLAERLACSRREAENYVEGGWVSVNGVVVEEAGFRITPDAQVDVAPKARPDDVKPVTILLNKPTGYGASPGSHSAAELLVPTHISPTDRSGLRVLKKHLADLALATPLETDASGLVVLTQERSIHRKLVEDAARVEQEFVVEVSGALSADGLKRLNHGLSWQGKPLAPIKVSWQSENHLRFALKTPPLGQVAYMCAQVGLTVVSMRRIRIGRLPLAGLASGQWRYLLGYERF